MNAVKAKYKLSITLCVSGFILIIVAAIQPVKEAIEQFKLIRNISLDYLSLFTPYLLSLVGSIFILLSTQIIQQRVKTTLLVFLIKNLAMILLFNIMMGRDITLNIANLYYIRHLDAYVLFLVYALCQPVLVFIAIFSIRHYEVSIK